MATSSAQQQTFTLLLKAQDEATSAIQDVHGALQKLGAGTDLTDLSNHLHTLGTDLASVGVSTNRMADAMATGFRSMEDSAHDGMLDITDAIIRGSTEQTEAIERAMGQQANAVERVGHAAEHAHGPLQKFMDFGKQYLVWGMLYGAINKVTEAIGGFAGGLVSVNANLEEYQQTFTAVYQSSQKGQAAVDWLTDFAAKVPATREQVIQAGLAVASLGDNVTQVMPALSNVSAVMGTTLPQAAQAFSDAQMGRFEMLQMTLHITKEELQKYGLELDNQGRVLNNSFVPAFEKLGQVRFASGAALQMDTFSGKMSNVADALTKLQELMGKPIFDLLKHQLDGLITFLGRADVLAWAHRAGEGFASMLAAGMKLAQWAMTNLGPPIIGAINLIAAAWRATAPAVAQAIGILQNVIGQLGTFLHDKVLPVVYQVLGQMAQWWNDHAKQIGQILAFMWGLLQTFWGSATSLFTSSLSILHGIWEIGWGAISGVFGSFIDLVTGNFARFGQDLKDMAGNIATGVLDIFFGLVERVVGILGHLTDPLTGLSQAFFSFASAAAGALYSAFTSVQGAIVGVVNGVIDTVNGAIEKLDKTFQSKTISILNPLTHKRQVVAQTPGLDIGTVGRVATPSGDARVWQWIDNLAHKQLTFGASGDQAVASIEALRKTWDADIRKFLGMSTAQRETQTGQNLMASLLSLAQRAGIKAPSFATGGAGASATDLSMPGAGTAAGTTDTKALQDAYTAATKHLEADLERNMPLAVLLADRARIRGAMVALKDSADDIFLEMTSTMKSIQDHIHQAAGAALDKAKQTLQYEEVLGLPYKTLLTQVNRIMKDLAATGVAPGSLEYRATYKQLIDEINKQGGSGTSPAVPSPAYGTYGGLATGYGQTTVSFGSTQQSGWAAVVAELRAQLAFWRSRALAEQRQLDAQQQTAQNTAQIARNTQSAADKMDQPGRGTTAAPVATAVRGVGGFQVMRRV